MDPKVAAKVVDDAIAEVVPVGWYMESIEQFWTTVGLPSFRVKLVHKRTEATMIAEGDTPGRALAQAAYKIGDI